ncbi:ABC transporter/ substrate binding / possibly Mndomain protein [Synechococcus sp. PROS-U-1]|nr:ABC transporter/ substrate binding / possibly Mndomain protein [Synechococcus sp. PROS-U-1]
MAYERPRAKNSKSILVGVVLAGVLTDVGRAGVSQLRDSDGFTPLFPRFHQRLIPADTSISL